MSAGRRSLARAESDASQSQDERMSDQDDDRSIASAAASEMARLRLRPRPQANGLPKFANGKVREANRGVRPKSEPLRQLPRRDKGGRPYSQAEGILHLDGEYALIYWPGSPTPTWDWKEEVAHLKYVYYSHRVKIRKRIVDYEMEMIGKESFFGLFPNSYLEKPEGIQPGDEDNREVALYQVKLARKEKELQALCSEMRLPPLYIDDWTDSFSDDDIPDFKLLSENILWNEWERNRSAVQKDLYNSNVNIPKVQCACRGGCTEKCPCVKRNSQYYYREDSTLAPKGSDRSGYHNVHVWECGDACGCAINCAQIQAQRLRLWSLVIFRHPGRGWTLRTVERIPAMKHVANFVGEIMTQTESESLNELDYVLGMNIQTIPAGRKGEKDTVVQVDISSKRMANETRFLAHSCEPNLLSLNVAYERKKEINRGIAFYSRKDIPQGCELTIDYGGAAPPSFVCNCGTPSCKNPPGGA